MVEVDHASCAPLVRIHSIQRLTFGFAFAGPICGPSNGVSVAPYLETTRTRAGDELLVPGD